MVIYTITNYTYRLGVIALVRSVRKYGFKGEIVVGITDGNEIKELKTEHNVRFIYFGEKLKIKHPTCLKPNLILEDITDDDVFCYLDADIIINTSRFFNLIENIGNKFCICMEGFCAQTDIRRRYWDKIFNTDMEINTDIYYNAGFFAGSRRLHSNLLQEWKNRMEVIFDYDVHFYQFPGFPLLDQDVLNSVLQNLDSKTLCTIQAPDWVGISNPSSFLPFCAFEDALLIHCTGKHKPWNIKMIPLIAPNIYDQLYFEFIREDKNLLINNYSYCQILWFKYPKWLGLLNRLRRLFNAIF